MILIKLEKEVGKPISHLFNMIAGANSSAIIAILIALKENKDSIYPKYKATDILEFLSEKQISSNIP